MELKDCLLKNGNGVQIRIMNYGAKVMSVKTPDRNGNLGEICLGYDTMEEYLGGNPYLGATIGRCANRISNASFKLNNKQYQLSKNIGEDHLHGGFKGFESKYWLMSDVIKSDDTESVKLEYTSPHLEEGYPGELKIVLKYSLNNENEFLIEYEAETSDTTIVNLTHHSFFNLKDGGKTDILSHKLKINADKYTPISDRLIPTGEVFSVLGSVFDFTSLKEIGKEIESADEQLVRGMGYDHNFIINKAPSEFGFVAEVQEPESGRKLEVFSSEPGVQLYTGNFINENVLGINGVMYQKRSAFCLETQHFPDSPNNDHFPSIELGPDDTYSQRTIYKFSILDNEA